MSLWFVGSTTEQLMLLCIIGSLAAITLETGLGASTQSQGSARNLLSNGANTIMNHPLHSLLLSGKPGS